MEIVIPSRYILTREVEVGCFAGVAYKLPDGKVKNELLWGTERFLSVEMAGQVEPGSIFTFYHIFVERYITQCLNRSVNDVDTFRFYLSRGDFPEEPSDLRGEVSNHFRDAEGREVWTSYEHISGPFLADPQYITSQFTAGRLDDISPVVKRNLIPERLVYKRNPYDLPTLGVILEPDEVSMDVRYLEDLLIREKPKKKVYLN